jgi:hypothetical protein
MMLATMVLHIYPHTYLYQLRNAAAGQPKMVGLALNPTKEVKKILLPKVGDFIYTDQ